MILPESEHWGTWQKLPDWQDFMWLSTSLVASHWGKLHYGERRENPRIIAKKFSLSRITCAGRPPFWMASSDLLRHLWAWSKRASCCLTCWLSVELALLKSILCFSGTHTGQSSLLQCFQCAMICRDDEQCATWHSLPELQAVMWVRTLFMVRQCGRLHWKNAT